MSGFHPSHPVLGSSNYEQPFNYQTPGQAQQHHQQQPASCGLYGNQINAPGHYDKREDNYSGQEKAYQPSGRSRLRN
eukprot:Pgem_evm1s1051